MAASSTHPSSHPAPHRARFLAGAALPLTLAAVYLAVGLALRVALGLRAGEGLDPNAAGLLRILFLGLVFDLVTLAWILLPVTLALVVLPRGLLRSRLGAAGLWGLAFLALALIGVDVVAEWVYWGEFESRFNFIAVDYLVYSHEVRDNIVESWPLGLVFGGIAAATIAAALVLRRPLVRAIRATRTGPRPWRALLAFAALAAAGFLGVRQSQADASVNRYQNELCKNGLYSWVEALRNPTLDYRQNYRALPRDEAFAELRRALTGSGAPGHDARPPAERAPRPHNVVLITVESLSARFLESFGGKTGITPHLDALASESLIFTRLLATGTRTVRGLESIALSIPPTAGRSILKRPENADMVSLGWVFREAGYDVTFAYGGNGSFDDMNRFFGGNGFDILDRRDLSDDEITFSNAWGVCDQDLLRRVLLECDDSHAAGRPFFTQVLTTSNHRPFTYPDVIDIPPGTSRRGAVRYTDLAIGEFIDAARARPWYDDTLFVIVADHCASSAGKHKIEPSEYHIPMLFHGPRIVSPGVVDRLASQVDVAPTLLALLGLEAPPTFFGQDLLAPGPERALLGNYQYLGLLEDGLLTVLCPRHEVAGFEVGPDFTVLSQAAVRPELLRRAIAFYQCASVLYAEGGLSRSAAPIDLRAAAPGRPQ